jgi:hypothetical protein
VAVAVAMEVVGLVNDGIVVVVVEVAGVWVSEEGSEAASVGSIISDGAVPPRKGESRSKVVPGGRLSDEIVSAGERCRPARRSRRSQDRLVEADRKLRTSEMEFEGWTFRGMAVRSCNGSGMVSRCTIEKHDMSYIFHR